MEAKFKVSGIVESIRPRDKAQVIVVSVDASYKDKSGKIVKNDQLIPVEAYTSWEIDVVSQVEVGCTVEIEGVITGRDWNGKVFCTLKPKKVNVTARPAAYAKPAKGNDIDDNDEIPF